MEETTSETLKTLIIYIMDGYETIHAFVDLSPDEYDFFSQAHGVTVVGVDDLTPQQSDAHFSMYYALAKDSRIGDCETDTQRKYFGKWVNSIVPLSDLNDHVVGIKHIISTTFAM